MSCNNATIPIDIKNTDEVLNCKGKCNLNYFYNPTYITATNKNDHILLDLAKESSTVLNYSTNTRGTSCNAQGGEYIINNITIYTPSLHTYDGKQADGEILIDHKNSLGGNDLFISIPITTRLGSQSNATKQLTKIIEYMKKVGNNNGEGGNVDNMELNLNDFIPNKGFYTYTGTIPIKSCESCIIFIVWDLNDGAAIHLNSSELKDLKSIINKKNVTIQPFTKDLGLAYNSSGASKTSTASDSIWIDCQPTGAEGEIIVNENKDESRPPISYNIDEYIGPLKIILGLILVILSYYCFGFIKNKIFKGGSSQSPIQSGGYHNTK